MFYNLVDSDGKTFDIAPENASDLFNRLKEFLAEDRTCLNSIRSEKEKAVFGASYALIFGDKSKSPDVGIVSLDSENEKLDGFFLQAKRIIAESNTGVSLQMVKEEHDKYNEMINSCKRLV